MYPCVGCTSIVGHKEDESVIVDLQIFQQTQDLANTVVKFHDCISIDPPLAFTQEWLGCVNRFVSGIRSPIQEEGFTWRCVVFYEAQSFLLMGDKIFKGNFHNKENQFRYFLVKSKYEDYFVWMTLLHQILWLFMCAWVHVCVICTLTSYSFLLFCLFMLVSSFHWVISLTKINVRVTSFDLPR